MGGDHARAVGSASCAGELFLHGVCREGRCFRLVGAFRGDGDGDVGGGVVTAEQGSLGGEGHRFPFFYGQGHGQGQMGLVSDA